MSASLPKKKIKQRPDPEDSELPYALAKHTIQSRATRGVSRRSVRETKTIRGYDVEKKFERRIKDRGIKVRF